MIKFVGKILKFIIDSIQLGFYYICLVFSKGFFFYFYVFFLLLEKILHLSIFTKIKSYFKNKQNNPAAFLMLVFIFYVGVFLYSYLYVSKSDIKYVDKEVIQEDIVDKPKQSIASDKDTYKSNEINLFRKYGQMDINQVDFSNLKEVNPDAVAWIMVDGTNVNYPVVQSGDNDYYLNHDIKKNLKASGWIFMDYRNSINLVDSNTIFYGHNLLNKTAFGSLSNVFEEKWFKNSNHYIVIRTENVRYVYQIFSCYYIDPEIYYLQTNFYRDSDYQEFLNTLKSRSKFDFGLDVSANDKIITLSTCTDDNKGRKVVHAKRVDI